MAKRTWMTGLLASLCLVAVACGGGGGGGSGLPPVTGARPTADFVSIPAYVYPGDSVQFTDRSLGSPTSWLWDFNGDGTPDSTERHPTHAFTTLGAYNVSLTAVNAVGTHTRTVAACVTVIPKVTTAVDLDADSNRDGWVSVGPDDDVNEDLWNTDKGAILYFNQDDDNANGQEDYKDAVSADTDLLDLTPVVIRQFDPMPPGATVRVSVSPAGLDALRVFRINGATATEIYSSGPYFDIPAADVEAGDVRLGLEATTRMFATWDGTLQLELDIMTASNVSLGTDTVSLRVAPPLFATNLWRASELHLVNIPGGGTQNLPFRTAMEALCADAGITYREAWGPTYSNDRWIQDSSEPAVVMLPALGQPRRVVDHVMQLARWRPVDSWCRNELLGPDFDLFERFSQDSNSHNYGGNLEVVPPHTGKPWGRIMVGGGTSNLLGTTAQVTSRMVQSYRDFFDAAAVQGPHLEVSSEWLAVGHVDEFSMFVPAPATARGWVCLMASPARAIQVLQATQAAGQGTATVFAGRNGWATTVNAILTDTQLMTLNQQAQARIDSIRDVMKAQIGLTDADFIDLPVMFEYVGGSYVAAYNPGVVNLICLPASLDRTFFAVPDPEGPRVAGVDQWQADIISQLQPLATPAKPFDIRFVDVFLSYHDLLGEAHCGSNTVRVAPAGVWWK